MDGWISEYESIMNHNLYIQNRIECDIRYSNALTINRVSYLNSK